MKSWQLPEHVADVLPTNARQLESTRERLLALFRVHGYELVQPPLMEYSHSLLTHIDVGLSLKTILVVDQLSGFHFLHVLLGMLILAWLAWRSGQGAYGPANCSGVESGVLYWHMVDLVWVLLFPLVYVLN